MKKLETIIIFLLLSLLPALSFAEIYTADIGQFERLKVNGNLSVVYKNLPDSTGLARYEAGPGGENVFSFQLKKEGTLKVQPSDDNWGAKNLPVLYVYSNFLSEVESASDKTVDISSVAPSASFKVRQIGNGTIIINNITCNTITAALTTGNGSIYISGNCDKASFQMVGTGIISADRLKANEIKCKILGTGSIGCWPLSQLKVSGIGTTKIYYKGTPVINKTGGGKLIQLPEKAEKATPFASDNTQKRENTENIDSTPSLNEDIENDLDEDDADVEDDDDEIDEDEDEDDEDSDEDDVDEDAPTIVRARD